MNWSAILFWHMIIVWTIELAGSFVMDGKPKAEKYVYPEYSFKRTVKTYIIYALPLFVGYLLK